MHLVHALTRDAVLERLLPPERAALAETAAEVVQSGGPGHHGNRRREL